MVRYWFKYNVEWRPLNLFATVGQFSNHISARALLNNIPKEY